jgi:hypothetical protein
LTSSAESLVGGSETSNADSVNEFFSGDGRAIAILKRERNSKVFGRRGIGWVIYSVATASAIAIRAREEKITAASIEIDGILDSRSSDGNGTDPELALFVG